MEDSGVAMKSICILFGEMGAGKNYWGQKWANWTGLDFVDGDDFAPPEMIEKVINFRPLTRDIVSKYLDILAEEIPNKADASKNGIVVAQALYRDADRQDLKLYLESLGYNVEFYWIKTPLIQNMLQLLKRPNGMKWVGYWLLNKPFFQKPTHAYKAI